MKLKIVFRKIQGYLKVNKMKTWPITIKKELLTRTLLKTTSRNVIAIWHLKTKNWDKPLSWESLRTVKYRIAQIKLTNNIPIIIVWATRTEWSIAFKDVEMIAVKNLLMKTIRSRILD